MNVCVVLEYRFSQTPDGAIWQETPYAASFWDQYLEVFEGVRVVARLRQVATPPPNAERADRERLAFVPIPYYVGPWAYARRAAAVGRALRRAIGWGDAVILRIPSHLASLVVPTLRRRGQPYAVQVVGDPYDVFAPGTVDHPLRPFFRWWFTRNQRRQCRGACAASYVTPQTLQRRYPPASDGLSIHFSCVQLGTFLAEGPRRITAKPCWRLVTVGSLAQLYKGIDTLLDAVAVCRQAGLNLELVIVGDGKFRSQLERQATALGLGPHVHFRGQLPAGAAVHAELLEADLFVMPSRTEGQPRAMIEAMAAALPCLGSTVGGIPELLAAEDLFPPNQPMALADKLQEVLRDPQRMTRMSQRNWEHAHDYQPQIIAERCRAFCEHLRTATEAWSAQGVPAPRPVKPASSPSLSCRAIPAPPPHSLP